MGILTGWFFGHEFFATPARFAGSRDDGMLPSNGHGALRRIDGYRGWEKTLYRAGKQYLRG
jgi:hypothetical protein